MKENWTTENIPDLKGKVINPYAVATSKLKKKYKKK